MRTIIAIVAIAAAVAPALAAGYPPIKNENFKKECSACHMAFQPQFLPQRSWQAIMSDLGNHFGEDASIGDPVMLQEISDYLQENAGDAGGKPTGMLRRLAAGKTPLRITELPRWIGAHSEEVGAKGWKRAGTKSNCAACHKAAQDGYYGDD